MVNPDLEVWIREHAPKSAVEAAHLAEVFMSARTGIRRTTFGHNSFFAGRSKSDGGERGGGTVGSRNHSSTRQLSTSKFNPAKKLHSGAKSDVRCYQCNQIGHTQYTCPATTQSKPSPLCSVPRPPLQNRKLSHENRKLSHQNRKSNHVTIRKRKFQFLIW